MCYHYALILDLKTHTYGSKDLIRVGIGFFNCWVLQSWHFACNSMAVMGVQNFDV